MKISIFHISRICEIWLVSIAVHPNGKFIYTVELDNHRVQKFFPNGTFISKFGYEETDGDGKKRSPHQLYVDISGNIYLTDRRNSEILKFNDNGDFIKNGDQRVNKMEVNL